MSIRKLFPEYPFIFRTPPKSKVRFGTRRLYVDLPWQVYHFLKLAMIKATEEDLSAIDIGKEWQKFLKENKNALTVNGKPFVTVFLCSPLSSTRPSLRMRIKWELFVEYLEIKASQLASEVEKDGEDIMKVYRDIWKNLLFIIGEVKPVEEKHLHLMRDDFRELLKKTGDFQQIEELLNLMQSLVDQLRRAEEESNVVSIGLYTSSVSMYIRQLHAALTETFNIPAAYLLLRNILEWFVKLVILLNVGRGINPNVYLYSMFFYEYEGCPKIYSLDRFKKKSIKKFLKILQEQSGETIYILEVLDKLQEKQVPSLGINRDLLRNFAQTYGLGGGNLIELYRACSTVIHNQPPLPFFSLLEIKFFKHFLKKFLITAEKLIEIAIPAVEARTSSLPYHTI
jgi:hypothetical protein